MDSAYKKMLLEQPEFKSFDYKESFQIKRLNAKINLNKTISEDLIFQSLVFYDFYEKSIFVHGASFYAFVSCQLLKSQLIKFNI